MSGLLPVHASHAAPSVQHFWLASPNGPRRAACVSESKSPRVELYACGTAAVPPDQAKSLVSDLEHRIIPTDLREFGHPRNFRKVVVLLSPLDSMTLGYFDENDILPSDPAHSNHANVIYVRPPYLMPDVSEMADVEEAAAHELQHLINFRIRVLDRHLPPQESWLNEGLAFYAQMANGFWTQRDVLKVKAAASDPGWSINSLVEGDRFLVRHARVAYGRAGLFVCDLVRRYGSSIARAVIRSPGSGLEEIDRALRARRPSASVRSAFAQWGADLVTSGATPQRWVGRLGLQHIQQASLVSAVTIRSDAPPWSSPSLRVRPWSQSFVTLRSSGSGALRVTLKTKSSSLFVALVATSSEDLARPRIAWFRPNVKGIAGAQIGNFGETYDSATLAASNAPALGSNQVPALFMASASVTPSGERQPTGH